MRISALISTPEIKTDALSIFKGNILENFKKAKIMGFDGVELVMIKPRENDPNYINRLKNELSLEIPALCTGQVYEEDNLMLINDNKDIEKRGIERFKEFVEFASITNSKINIGRFRGKIINNNFNETIEKAINIFKKISDFSNNYNVEIILEPINRFQTEFIFSTEDGIKIIKKVNKNNFKLMVDTFHINIEDRSISDSIFKSKKYLSHVHICDNNRYYPGYGHFNFDLFFKSLKKINYMNYLSAEIFPYPSPEIASKKTIIFFKKYKNINY